MNSQKSQIDFLVFVNDMTLTQKAKFNWKLSTAPEQLPPHTYLSYLKHLNIFILRKGLACFDLLSK